MQFVWHTKFLLPPFDETVLLWYRDKVLIGVFEKGPCTMCGDPACFQPRFYQKGFSECIRLGSISGWCLPYELKPRIEPLEAQIEEKG